MIAIDLGYKGIGARIETQVATTAFVVQDIPCITTKLLRIDVDMRMQARAQAFELRPVGVGCGRRIREGSRIFLRIRYIRLAV
ncbi:MAG: hypothetical protein WBN40_02660 [Pseudomonadales bacterium]